MSESRVEWRRLKTASGTAEAIPEALARLCSPDKKTREAAYWKIDNHAVLQGDLYEAAPFVVKGLVDCLRTAPVAKEEIYDLLVEFANGYAPENQIVTLEGSEYPVKVATSRELAKPVDLYLQDLRDPSTSTRKRVAELLLALSEEIEIEAKPVEHALANETEKEIRELLGEILQRT